MFFRALSRRLLLWFPIGLLLCTMTAASAALPWALPGWKYRRVVQVYNNGATVLTAPVLAIDDVPFSLLVSMGKLAEDGADLRLFDETGAPVAILPQHLLSDNGDARIQLALPELKPRERRIYTLYYGNPQPGKTGTAAVGALTDAVEAKVGVGAEESAVPEPAVTGLSLDRWLSGHLFREAESGKGNGFTAQAADTALAPVTSGASVLAANGEPGSVAFDFEVAAGAYTCWVRCLPGAATVGKLMLSVEQGGKTLAQPVNPFEGNDTPGYRWCQLRVTTAKGQLQVVARSDRSHAALDCLVLTRDAQYRPDYRDFQGRVWVRWRIDAPAEYRYWSKIYHELDPWMAKFKYAGLITPFGLLAEVGGPYNATPFTGDADFFAARQYSSWVLLPTSRALQWHSVLFFPPKPGSTLPDNLAVRLEFANRPSPERIFHITPGEPLELRTATCGVHMPVVTTLEGLSQLETFTEWAQRRSALVKQLKLSAPPRLTKLQVGTWDFLNTRLSSGGTVPRERANIDFDELEALGINMGVIQGVDDELFGSLAKEHGMIVATWSPMAEGWRYTREAQKGQYDYLDANETPPQRWQRVMDDYMSKQVANAQKKTPNLLALAKYINLGDEIIQVSTAAEIAKTPQLLAYFREWLKARDMTPADFGAADWNGVQPLGDRKALGDDEGAKARAFYWTARFHDDYTAMFYRTATEAVQKYAGPHVVYVNYQAGPMQAGWLGNDNRMDSLMMDIFHIGRARAFTGALTEDWVPGWDMGIGRINLGNEILRATVRKHNLPLANYLIGGVALRARFYAMLSLGVKEIDLYLYGPISNVGPAWAESKSALTDIAAVTREVKKFEDAIAAGEVRPRKAALLITPTADIMQKKGLYYTAERQAFYTALAHSNLPVDVISEEEIEEDNALSKYSLLYVTDPNVRDATQRNIAAWVHDGGRLWACVGGANWDEYNRPSATLNAVFGVATRDMVTQEKWLPRKSSFAGQEPVRFAYQQLGTVKASSPLLGGALEVPAWGVKLDSTPTTAQVLGTYEDGTPAVLLNAYGKGQALLVGALVGEAYVRQHYPEELAGVGKIGWSFDGGAPARRLADALTASAKVTRPVTLSLPGIYTSVMDSPQGSLLFLNNATLFKVTDFTDAQVPTVTVSMPEMRKVISITSVKTGAVKFTRKNGVVTFKVTLPNTDVIFLKCQPGSR